MYLLSDVSPVTFSVFMLQVTLLESREKCEIKLTKPLKFLTGRIDCDSDDPDGRGYVTTQHEVRALNA